VNLVCTGVANFVTLTFIAMHATLSDATLGGLFSPCHARLEFFGDFGELERMSRASCGTKRPTVSSWARNSSSSLGWGSCSCWEPVFAAWHRNNTSLDNRTCDPMRPPPPPTVGYWDRKNSQIGLPFCVNDQESFMLRASISTRH
jgi:hypothetical protein